jgi:methyl-accepting chemotaxis protein
VERAEQGAALAGQANADMERVVESIRHVSRVVEQISLASAEQSSGVAQMGQAVHQMDQVTQKNAAMVEASTEASETLRKQAHALEDAMAAFRTGAMARA